MRAAGARPALQPAQAVAFAEDAVVGPGGLTGGIRLHPPAANLGALAQRQVDMALGGRRAARDDGPVDLLDQALLEQPADPRQSLAVAAEDKAAAGVAIEP